MSTIQICRAASAVMVAGAIIAVTAAAATAHAQGADPFIGKWTLDVAKSKFSPGPAPKSGTVTFTAGGPDRITVVVDGVNAAGAQVHWDYTAAHDGKDYPTTNNPDGDMVVLKRLSPRSVEITTKKSGKVTLVTTRTVSTDGKTLTVTSKGTDGQGRMVNNVQVFEKS